jgi:DNA modification methylase
VISIIRGDARDVAELVEPHSIKAVITSPPRCGEREHELPNALNAGHDHESYLKNTRLVLDALKKVLMPDGIVFWHLGNNDDPIMPARVELLANGAGWCVHKRIIWQRSRGHQSILRLSPTTLIPWIHEENEEVQRWPESTFWHPQFGTLPLELYEWCMLRATRAFDTVLDPFAGSGQCGIAAAKLARHAILVDIEYQDLQELRCAEYLGTNERQRDAGTHSG